VEKKIALEIQDDDDDDDDDDGIPLPTKHIPGQEIQHLSVS